MSEEQISAGHGRVLQKRKKHPRGLTAARRRNFLDALAGNCNVRRSAQMTGVNVELLYANRRRDPEFAQQWQDALAIGYARLEEAVLAYSLKSVQAPDLDVDLDLDSESGETEAIASATPGDISPEAIKMAMDIAAKHRNEARGAGFDKVGRRRATTEETDAVLRRKLDALARKVRAQLGNGAAE